MTGLTDPSLRFARLQRERLAEAWRRDRRGCSDPNVVVALPSFSLDRSVYEHYGERVGPLENRFLCVLLLTLRAGTRVVYLSSRPVPPALIDVYLSLVAPEEQQVITDRTLLLSPDDPSPRPLAAKLLDRPDLLATACDWIGDDPAMLEAWNVTDTERDLALAMDVPIFGTSPEHWPLAIKSGGRELFQLAGVPHPAGVEHVTSPAWVASAIARLRQDDPLLGGVVVKLDDSVAGDGNVVLRLGEVPHGDLGAIERLVESSLPAWYVQALKKGGVVEALISGDDFCSPSGQANVLPDGSVEVLSTHDQRLGGPDRQVYEGCSFPADPAYAPEIALQVQRVGTALAAHGVRGRFAVDFAAVRRNGWWELFALEINLRKGGTTHPFGITRLLIAGHYDPSTGRFVLADGSSRCYGATDNLVDDAWRDRSPADVQARLVAAGVAYDREAQVGVIPHLLDCLPLDGRMGYTAIGRDRDQVAALEAATCAALR